MVCQDQKDHREWRVDKVLQAQVENLVIKEKLEYLGFLVLLEGMDCLVSEGCLEFLDLKGIQERMVLRVKWVHLVQRATRVGKEPLDHRVAQDQEGRGEKLVPLGLLGKKDHQESWVEEAQKEKMDQLV